MAFSGFEIVEKSNTLNEIRLNGMTLQQLRFFSIYLAKINARDVNTRKVIFKLEDFQKIMEIGRMNIQHFQEVTNGLLCKVYNQMNDDGGYTGFTLFKRCRIFKDKETEDWSVEIEASDDALPLMFNIKKNYFKYQLWNALRLKSANQIRMYELLKQYEKTGKLEITVKNLRNRLDMTTEYPRWNNFKARVLDSCQQALAENTDITYTYERGKTGNGGKWLTIIFHISKNPKFVDKLSLNEFIEQQEVETGIEEPQTDEDLLSKELTEQLASACGNEFTAEELQGLYTLMSAFVDEQKLIFYFKTKISELNYRASKKTIKNRYGYIRKLIDNDYQKHLQQGTNKTLDSYGATYDIKEYESHSVVDEEEYKPKESYRAAYDIAEFEKEKGDEEEW